MSTAIEPATLGFLGDEASGWTKQTCGGNVQFRLLRTLRDLGHAEQLQEAVFGVSERDLIPANELIVVEETGGAVIAAFLPGEPGVAAGVLVGWGGFAGHPRVVSDFLAVRPEARNLGLAVELKRLQAAIALGRGFVEIVWTVDPLRAANAHLNFAKLGATARHYEIDRYGSTYASGLYGGLPSDRLHVTWEITTARVRDRLLGIGSVAPADALPFTPASANQRVTIALPPDIDALLTAAPAEGQEWRLRLRDELTQAFAEGLVITGFLPTGPGQPPRLLLERDLACPGAPAP